MQAPLADTFCTPAYRSFRAAAAVLERIISAGPSPISLRQIMHGSVFPRRMPGRLAHYCAKPD